jgi:Prealbumin-like fold domain
MCVIECEVLRKIARSQHTRISTLVGVVSALVTAMCVSVANSQTNTPELTGIQGDVMVSPSRPGPVKKESDFPNAAPLANAKFSVSNNQQVITTFTTDAEGRFKIHLKPGRYSVSLAEHRFPRPCGPFEVTVETGTMTNVEWRCDSGMR